MTAYEIALIVSEKQVEITSLEKQLTKALDHINMLRNTLIKVKFQATLSEYQNNIINKALFNIMENK